MSVAHDYYRILQVQPDAAPEVIRSSYRTLMQTLRIHPDLGGDPNHAALINEAYTVLSDPARRQAYDGGRLAPARADRVHGPTPACAFCGSPLAGLNSGSAGESSCCPTCGAPAAPPGAGGLAGAAPGVDGRSVLRIEHDAPLRFRRGWPQAKADRGTVQDISFNGMRLLCEVTVGTGDLLLLDCAVLVALGRVLDVRPRDRQQQVRVAFESVALQQRQGGFIQVRA